MWQELDVGGWSARRRADLTAVNRAVDEIIKEVSSRGDPALLDLCERFDGIRPESLAVTPEEREKAYDQVEPRLIEALAESEARISWFHERQLPRGLWLEEVEPGITLGVKTAPLARVGAYIPGGRAAYPSTALMTAVPARIAGVKEICACTPPPVHPLTLVALDIAGVEEIYRVGGAQAVAAMALGTGIIPAVEKIVGPGNVYVTAAKVRLRDRVEIDFPAGPSEIAVIADTSAHPRYVAADILAQAEHDPNAACALITTDPALPEAVWREMEQMLPRLSRRETMEASLAHSGYVVAADLDEAVTLAATLAPEHLSLQVGDPLAILDRVRNAGSIFIGPHAAVACGDYASGTNHVLPTAGYARTFSGLDVHHFLTRSSVQAIDRRGLDTIGDAVETLARAEGLDAHAASVRIRRDE
ncbi:MAG: histidinol dehydrogenase [Methanomicrobiales archaeon]